MQTKKKDEKKIAGAVLAELITANACAAETLGRITNVILNNICTNETFDTVERNTNSVFKEVSELLKEKANAAAGIVGDPKKATNEQKAASDAIKLTVAMTLACGYANGIRNALKRVPREGKSDLIDYIHKG